MFKVVKTWPVRVGTDLAVQSCLSSIPIPEPSIRPSWLVILSISLIAGSATAGPKRAASAAHKKNPIAASNTVRPDRARSQKPQIGKAKRRVVLHKNFLRLPDIRSLPAGRGVVKAGLRRYLNTRNRIRELRHLRSPDIKVSSLARVGSFAIHRIDFRKASKTPKLKVLVVGGVHAGSERVGVESALRFAERLGTDPRLLDSFDITVVPLVNPTGLAIRSRRNRDNVDINRSFAAGQWTAESKALARIIKAGKFDVVLDLHGARKFRNGFFVIRGTNDGGLSERFTMGVPGLMLLDQAGAGKTYGLDAPGVVTSGNQGTLKQYAVRLGVRRSYTIEAPERLPANEQIEGTIKLVHSALHQVRADQ